MSKKIATTTLLSIALLLLALASSAQQRIDERRPASPGGLVTVSNVSGSVIVKGWDKAEVAVMGTLGKGSERLEFEVSGDSTTIKVVLPKNAHHVDGSDLEIRVPAGSRLDVNTVSADITASDLTGSLGLQTVSGAVSSTGPAKEVEAQSVSGNIKVDTSAPRISAQSVSGDVTVTAASSPQEVKLESVSGELSFDGGVAQGGSFTASTVSGSIRAALPSGLAADFSLGTFSGGLETAFGDKSTASPEDHSGKRLNFTTGGGGARVKVKTFSGDISLIKR
jgi:DUF4097 and DUF4098 domain-containing protein YvlB